VDRVPLATGGGRASKECRSVLAIVLVQHFEGYFVIKKGVVVVASVNATLAEQVGYGRPKKRRNSILVGKEVI
jgi:hypothetical protein